MSCHNPFCTCYEEGLRDGYRLGYRRGRQAGYISGYVDAAKRLSPPEELYHEIRTRLAPYQLPRPSIDYTNPMSLLPKPRKARCYCVGVCICGE
jgi:hypothetical protein